MDQTVIVFKCGHRQLVNRLPQAVIEERLHNPVIIDGDGAELAIPHAVLVNLEDFDRRR